MGDEKLNFNPDDLGGFDAAGSSGDDDLGGFDAAAGVTFVPGGWYLCKLEAGDLLRTKSTGKRAYRLRFSVIEPAEHVGFALWRYYTLDTQAAQNQAKAALSPLGLTNQVKLRVKPFPEAGRSIICRVLVGVQQKPDGSTGNDVIRFTVERDDRTPPNPFAVSPDGGEGGKP
jgi:hypothetical protein